MGNRKGQEIVGKRRRMRLTEQERKRLWRKILGYRIGETVRISYLIPVTFNGNRIGETHVFVEGRIVEIGKEEIKLQQEDGTTIILKERLCSEAERENSS